MRLINFLNDDNYILEDKSINNVESPTTEEDFYKLLLKNCKNNIKFMKNNNVRIYRGISSKTDPYLKFSGTKKRVSANASNHYTIMFSEMLDSWKDIPKRDHSLICSTSLLTAGEYGQLYMVIPYDDTKIGIANSDDFWFIIQKNRIFSKSMILSLNTLNIHFSQIINDTKKDIENFLNKTIYDLPYTDIKYNFLKHILLYSMNITPKDNSYETLNKIINQNKTLYSGLKMKSLFNSILDPKKLNVDVKKFSEFPFIKNSEVWMDKKALLISTEYYENFKKFENFITNN